MKDERIIKILNFLDDKDLNEFVSFYIKEYSKYIEDLPDGSFPEPEEFVLHEVVLPELYKREQYEVNKNVLQKSYDIDKFSSSLPSDLKYQFDSLNKAFKENILILLTFIDYNYKFLSSFDLNVSKPNLYEILEDIIPILSKLSKGVSFYDLPMEDQKIYDDVYLLLMRFMQDNFDNPYSNVINI